MKKHTNEKHFCCVYQDCHWNGTFYRRDKLVDHVMSQHKETRESAKHFVKNSTPSSRNERRSLGIVRRGGKNRSPLPNHLRSNYPDEVELRRPNNDIESWADVDLQAGYDQEGVLIDAHYYGGQARCPQFDGLAAVSATADVDWHSPSCACVDTRRNFRFNPESMIPYDGYSTSMLNDDSSLEYRC